MSALAWPASRARHASSTGCGTAASPAAVCHGVGVEHRTLTPAILHPVDRYPHISDRPIIPGHQIQARLPCRPRRMIEDLVTRRQPGPDARARGHLAPPPPATDVEDTDDRGGCLVDATDKLECGKGHTMAVLQGGLKWHTPQAWHDTSLRPRCPHCDGRHVLPGTFASLCTQASPPSGPRLPRRPCTCCPSNLCPL
jgi:hypothetical protein